MSVSVPPRPACCGVIINICSGTFRFPTSSGKDGRLSSDGVQVDCAILECDRIDHEEDFGMSIQRLTTANTESKRIDLRVRYWDHRVEAIHLGSSEPKHTLTGRLTQMATVSTELTSQAIGESWTV
jgi:hypothetical protein